MVLAIKGEVEKDEERPESFLFCGDFVDSVRPFGDRRILRPRGGKFKSLHEIRGKKMLQRDVVIIFIFSRHVVRERERKEDRKKEREKGRKKDRNIGSANIVLLILASQANFSNISNFS